MLAGARFDTTRMAGAAADEMIAATDIADLLVELGVPFRDAHGVVAGLVRTAVERGAELSQLTDAEIAAASPQLADDPARLRAVLSPERWLESKISQGGTAAVRLAEQLSLAEAVLDGGPAA
jgi:argininosuccinate lyase